MSYPFALTLKYDSVSKSCYFQYFNMKVLWVMSQSKEWAKFGPIANKLL